MRFSWVWKRWSWWEVELVNISYYIPYSFMRQDAVVTQTTFYGVAGLKSLANHWLRSYHTHKVWCGGADEGLIEYCKEAKLQARIKPTALCSAIDKENSIEFSLDLLHYLYNYYMVCALFSHAYHVTHHVTSCDVTLVTWHFPALPSV